MTNVPAGWYPDEQQPGGERWWDGFQWSEHRRPASVPLAPVPPAPTPQVDWSAHTSTAYSAHPLITPDTPAERPGSAMQPPAAAANKPLWKRTWFIVTAVVVALIVVGSVSSAIAGGNRGRSEPVAADVTPVASPMPTPTEASSSPAPAPKETPSSARNAVDPTYFKAAANKQLDDYSKDLDDLTEAAAKGSSFRVMSNNVELAFNEAQLATLEPTDNITTEWTIALAGLSITTTQLADAGSKDDYTTLNSAIIQAKQQVQSLRDIAARAA